MHRRLFSSRIADSLKNFIVSSEDIQAYKLHGIVCLHDVLSVAQCAEMRQAFIEFMKENKGFIHYAKDDKRFFSAAFMSNTTAKRCCSTNEQCENGTIFL